MLFSYECDGCDDFFRRQGEGYMDDPVCKYLVGAASMALVIYGIKVAIDLVNSMTA